MTRVLASIRWRTVCLAAALALCAGTAQGQDDGTLALAPTQADQALRPLAQGFDVWLRGQLEAAGIQPARLEPGDGLQQTFSLAVEQHASYVLVPRLSSRDGEASVHLLLYAPDTRALLVGARAMAPIAELGDAAMDVLRRVVPQLGGDVAMLVTPPLLEDLASSTQAVEARLAGDLPRAWRAVQGRLSPTAMQLREEIVDEARRSGTPATSRARVLAATGDTTTAWSLIGRKARAELKKESPDADLLAAAGEVMLLEGAVHEARRYFSRALETQLDHVGATFGLGEVLALEGDDDGARRELSRASELEPKSPRALTRLAELEADPSRAAAHWIAAGRL